MWIKSYAELLLGKPIHLKNDIILLISDVGRLSSRRIKENPRVIIDNAIPNRIVWSNISHWWWGCDCECKSVSVSYSFRKPIWMCGYVSVMYWWVGVNIGGSFDQYSLHLHLYLPLSFPGDFPSFSAVTSPNASIWLKNTKRLVKSENKLPNELQSDHYSSRW